MTERKKKNYVEREVVAQLMKKADIHISGNQIQECNGKTAKGDVGIHSKGKIDFLVKYCGYVHFYVPEFSRK